MAISNLNNQNVNFSNITFPPLENLLTAEQIEGQGGFYFDFFHGNLFPPKPSSNYHIVIINYNNDLLRAIADEGKKIWDEIYKFSNLFFKNCPYLLKEIPLNPTYQVYPLHNSEKSPSDGSAGAAAAALNTEINFQNEAGKVAHDLQTVYSGSALGRRIQAYFRGSEQLVLNLIKALQKYAETGSLNGEIEPEQPRGHGSAEQTASIEETFKNAIQPYQRAFERSIGELINCIEEEKEEEEEEEDYPKKYSNTELLNCLKDKVLPLIEKILKK